MRTAYSPSLRAGRRERTTSSPGQEDNIGRTATDTCEKKKKDNVWCQNFCCSDCCWAQLTSCLCLVDKVSWYFVVLKCFSLVKKNKNKNKTTCSLWLMLVLIWCPDTGKRRCQKKIVRKLLLLVLELSFNSVLCLLVCLMHQVCLWCLCLHWWYWDCRRTHSYLDHLEQHKWKLKRCSYFRDEIRC